MEEVSDVQHFAKLIKEIKFTMMTTISESDGSLKSRPLTLQQVEFDGDLWFFCRKSSELVHQIQANPNVNLSFSDPKDSSYISACGHGIIVDDTGKEKELWNAFYKPWFPEGLEDPELCLIKVTVESADYWESPSSKIVTMVNFAKNILSGKKENNFIPGKHGHLNLN